MTNAKPWVGAQGQRSSSAGSKRTKLISKASLSLSTAPLGDTIRQQAAGVRPTALDRPDNPAVQLRIGTSTQAYLRVGLRDGMSAPVSLGAFLF